jgi:hypothetical protein
MTGTTAPQATEQNDIAARNLLALVEFMGQKHYGQSAADFNLDENGAVQCIRDNISALDVINECAEDFNLDRIDKSDYGVPSQTLLNDADLKAAMDELNFS